MERYSYWAKREIKTYAYLYNGAKSTLEVEKNIERGGFYQVMASLFFSAFAIEGWLNHLGRKKIRYWEEIERIPTISKLKVLYQYLGLNYNSSKRPIQTIIELFRFRNLMAHAKTETLEKRGTLKAEPGIHENLIETKWEKYCNKKNAGKVLTDVAKIFKELGRAAGEKYPVSWLGSEESVIDPAP